VTWIFSLHKRSPFRGMQRNLVAFMAVAAGVSGTKIGPLTEPHWIFAFSSSFHRKEPCSSKAVAFCVQRNRRVGPKTRGTLFKRQIFYNFFSEKNFKIFCLLKTGPLHFVQKHTVHFCFVLFGRGRPTLGTYPIILHLSVLSINPSILSIHLSVLSIHPSG